MQSVEGKEPDFPLAEASYDIHGKVSHVRQQEPLYSAEEERHVCGFLICLLFFSFNIHTFIMLSIFFN